MKVLFINQFYAPDHSATAQLLTNLAEDLAVTESVSVLCSRGRYEGGPWLPARERLNGVDVRRLSATSLGKKSVLRRATDYASFLGLVGSALAVAPRPDVVVSLTTPPMLGPLTSAISRTRRIPTVLWLQDVYPDVAVELGYLRATSGTARALARSSQLAYAAARRIVVLSDHMKNRLVQRGVPAAKVSTIANWADARSIRPIDPQTSAVRKALNVPPGHLLAMYSGNFGLAHELDTFIDAARELERLAAPVRFAFVGAGARREETERRSGGLRNVGFYPYQPYSALSDSLGAADVHLVSLRTGLEGLIEPSKLYGVMAAGRAVIYVGPPKSEPAEVIERYGTGWVARPGDTASVVSALLDAHADRTRLMGFGRAARQAFSSSFDRTVAVERWHELLRDEVRGAPAS